MSSVLTINGERPENSQGSCLDLSVAIVSFNTREVLRRCLKTLEGEAAGLSVEVLVVDNGSQDGSVEMISTEFPRVRLIQAGRNLGFAAANNLMLAVARGKYLVLLNSDAFLQPGALQKALEHMEQDPEIGLGGARLIGEDGAWQPSARQFPSVTNDFLAMTGLSHRFRTSRFFGRADRTWADPMQETDTDWVPGAFSIIRTTVLEKVGFFDEAFFLYYEEVDLCRRIKTAGYKIRYWADVVVVHIGGESSKSLLKTARSNSGAQLTLWRLRSEFLYYRKNHGGAAWRAKAVESAWHRLRLGWNRTFRRAGGREKAVDSQVNLKLIKRAWQDTRGGRTSPPTPWRWNELSELAALEKQEMSNGFREDWRTYEGNVLSPGMWVMAVYRFGRWRYGIKWSLLRKPFSLAYKLMFAFVQAATGTELPCEARVGHRLRIDHSQGIVISGDAWLGDDVILRNGVTIGLKHTGVRGSPVIGDRADIGAGAKILGPIHIGNDVSIGANAVVLCDVPDNSIAVGVPARIASKKSGDRQASSTMGRIY